MSLRTIYGALAGGLWVFSTPAIVTSPTPIHAQTIARMEVTDGPILFADGFWTGESYSQNAKLSLTNSKLAYYSYAVPDLGDRTKVYFFYQGMYVLQFACEITSSSGTGMHLTTKSALRKTVFLLGGRQYLATPAFSARGDDCAVNIREVSGFAVP